MPHGLLDPDAVRALLVDASVKGVVVLAAAGVASLALRRASAAVRHLVWLGALVALLALPLLGAALPRLVVHVPLPGLIAAGAVPSPEDVAAAAQVGADAGPAIQAPAIRGDGVASAPGGRVASEQSAPVAGFVGASPELAAEPASGSPASAAAPASPAVARLHALDWAGMLLALWFAGAATLLLGMGAGLLRVSWLARRSRRLVGGRAAAVVERSSARLGLARAPVLLEGGAEAMPMTWGVVRPVLLLPAGAAAWSSARLEAVVLHELAHVRRRDALTQLVGEAACALYWFNPLAWLAARRLRIERELACDDVVLNAGSRPSEYAGELLALARWHRAARATAPAAIAMARPSQLTGRLLAVLDEGRSRAGVTRRAAVPAAAAAAAVAALAALSPARELPAQTPSTPAAPRCCAAPAVPPAPAAAPMPAIPATPSQPSVPSRPGLPPVPAAAVLPSGPCSGADSRNVSVSSHSDDDVQDIRWTSGDCSLTVHVEGTVRYTPDFRGIASVSRDGRFRIVEQRGEEVRRLEVRSGADGAPAYAWSVNGAAHPFDAEGRAWLADALTGLFRATGFAAAERVAYLRAHGGVERVLQEVDSLRGDYVRRIYLQRLIEGGGLDGGAVARLVAQAGREIRSDYDLAEVLTLVAKRYPLDERTRQPFVEAARSIGSAYDLRRVLTAALDGDRLSTASAAAVVDAARGIGSDYDLAEVLTRVAANDLTDPEVQRAYLEATLRFRSDYDHHRVLSALLRQRELSPEIMAMVLASARGIHSDYDRAEVLLQTAATQKLTGNLRDAYLQAAGEIRSSYDRTRATAALARQGR